jgi:hypothetical protein
MFQLTALLKQKRHNDLPTFHSAAGQVGLRPSQNELEKPCIFKLRHVAGLSLSGAPETVHE